MYPTSTVPAYWTIKSALQKVVLLLAIVRMGTCVYIPSQAEAAEQNARFSEAKTGKCVFQVDGKTYINGKCYITKLADEFFEIEGDKRGHPSSDYFVYFSPNRLAATADGYWNGAEKYQKASEPLGELSQQRNCWTNVRVKFCLATETGKFRSPADFVKSLYDPYRHDNKMSVLADRRAAASTADALLEPNLARMWHASIAKNRGGIGPIDGDPICACQEAEISTLRIQTLEYSATRASVNATFQLGQQTRKVNFDLIRDRDA